MSPAPNPTARTAIAVSPLALAAQAKWAFSTRRVRQDTDVHGVALHTGEWVEVGIASANRDEDVYADSEAFRLDRPDPRDHLAFGAGSHVCPGATLARLEAVTAVQVLLARLASMSEVAGTAYPPVPGNLGGAPIPAVLTPHAKEN